MAKSTLGTSLIACFALLMLLSPVTVFALEKAEGKYCVEKNYLPTIKTVTMVVTAYSDDEWQTDNTPRTMASNKEVKEGYVANNGLPFGTKIRIPELYGNRVLEVWDRMAERKGNRHLDIFMEETKDAQSFGAKWGVKVEILGEPKAI